MNKTIQQIGGDKDSTEAYVKQDSSGANSLLEDKGASKLYVVSEYEKFLVKKLNKTDDNGIITIDETDLKKVFGHDIYLYEEGSTVGDADVAAEGVDSKALYIKVEVKEYGVMGYNNTQKAEAIAKKKAEKTRQLVSIPENTVICDPAGIGFIRRGFSGAGGASGGIYTDLGLTGEFHVDVKNSVKEECDAEYYSHTITTIKKQPIIHVVGPNFNESPNNSFDLNTAIKKLSYAYYNVLRIFANKVEKTLRLLPISGSIFSGRHKGEDLTFRALLSGFKKLSIPDKEKLESKKIEMCIFMVEEYKKYSDKYKELLPPGDQGGGYKHEKRYRLVYK